MYIFVDNKLYDSSVLLRTQNVQLESQIIRGNACGDSMVSEKISTLEQKLLTQQEELTELHRRRGENAQMIIDLNAKLQLTEQTVASKNARSVVQYYLCRFLFVFFLFSILNIFLLNYNDSSLGIRYVVYTQISLFYYR